MKSLELLEARLAEALQALGDAAKFVREAEGIDTDKNMRRMGGAINLAWEIREEIYAISPDLKPDFIKESEEDNARYENLRTLSESAYLAEENKDKDKARKLFQELKDTAKHGYFVMVAEAGLYRIGPNA